MPLTPTQLGYITDRNFDVSFNQERTIQILLQRQYSLLESVTNLDNAYKVLFDEVNAEINSYNNEYTKLDCNNRLSITEDMLVQAASDTQDPNLNPLFYNNAGTVYLRRYTTPNILRHGIGLPSGTQTTDCITAYKSAIDTAITAFGSSGTVPQRATGQSCTGTNTIATNNTVVNAMNALKTAVSNYLTFITSLKNLIYTTSNNAARNAQGEEAKTSIDTTITAINTWTSLPDFIPVAVNTLCTTFNALTIGNTKANSTNLTNLQNALNTQATNSSTRTGQLAGYLGNGGSITQNNKFGTLPGLTNDQYNLLYYERAIFMNARVGRPTGSLRQKIKIANEIEEQVETRSTLFTVLSVERYL